MITSTYFVMTTGTTPSWTGRDPRAQLTNINAHTWQQVHPSLAGAEGSNILDRIRAWFRGDR